MSAEDPASPPTRQRWARLARRIVGSRYFFLAVLVHLGLFGLLGGLLVIRAVPKKGIFAPTDGPLVRAPPAPAPAQPIAPTRPGEIDGRVENEEVGDPLLGRRIGDWRRERGDWRLARNPASSASRRTRNWLGGVRPFAAALRIDSNRLRVERSSMTASSVDISGLSAGQKVALMERLWRSLASDVQVQGPPVWHEQELDTRREEWARRESAAEDWPLVREQLRRERP